VTLLTGGYVLYPMAEVLSVYNAATGTVDGTMTLAANMVPWGTGDTVEEPHYYQQRTYPDTEYVTQYVPRPQAYTSAGKTYQGTVGPGVRGWAVTNGAPASQYLGAGGTHNLPDYAYVVAGAWNRDFDVQAGNQAVIWAHCNLNGCNRWDSTYSLFALDSAAGYGADNLSYAPQSSTATWRLGGAQYSFSPTSFTAGTINVGTLNATTITGGVSGAAITSGTVSAARLPLFGPSGASHAAGVVPDPGATAGATRYLREDGSWVADGYGDECSDDADAGRCSELDTEYSIGQQCHDGEWTELRAGSELHDYGWVVGVLFADERKQYDGGDGCWYGSVVVGKWDGDDCGDECAVYGGDGNGDGGAAADGDSECKPGEQRDDGEWTELRARSELHDYGTAGDGDQVLQCGRLRRRHGVPVELHHL
jgi:hypothetical protein